MAWGWVTCRADGRIHAEDREELAFMLTWLLHYVSRDWYLCWGCAETRRSVDLKKTQRDCAYALRCLSGIDRVVPPASIFWLDSLISGQQIDLMFSGYLLEISTTPLTLRTGLWVGMFAGKTGVAHLVVSDSTDDWNRIRWHGSRRSTTKKNRWNSPYDQRESTMLTVLW